MIFFEIIKETEKLCGILEVKGGKDGKNFRFT